VDSYLLRQRPRSRKIRPVYGYQLPEEGSVVSFRQIDAGVYCVCTWTLGRYRPAVPSQIGSSLSYMKDYLPAVIFSLPSLMHPKTESLISAITTNSNHLPAICNLPSRRQILRILRQFSILRRNMTQAGKLHRYLAAPRSSLDPQSRILSPPSTKMTTMPLAINCDKRAPNREGCNERSSQMSVSHIDWSRSYILWGA
jgi:hypothetical protein